MKKSRDFPSFEVLVATLPANGYALKLRPDSKTCAHLAKAAGLSNISMLEADIVLKRWRRDGVELIGQLRADVEQPCIVTLEPVFQQINQHFSTKFIADGSSLSIPVGRVDRELVLDPEGEDPPESYSHDKIDVWPVVCEALFLAIEPFPRIYGARLPDDITGVLQDGEPLGAATSGFSPFAVLEKINRDD